MHFTYNNSFNLFNNPRGASAIMNPIWREGNKAERWFITHLRSNRGQVSNNQISNLSSLSSELRLLTLTQLTIQWSSTKLGGITTFIPNTVPISGNLVFVTYLWAHHCIMKGH